MSAPRERYDELVQHAKDNADLDSEEAAILEGLRILATYENAAEMVDPATCTARLPRERRTPTDIPAAQD